MNLQRALSSFASIALVLIFFFAVAGRAGADGAPTLKAAPIDWAQPPVACVEEVVPALPSRPCLDLSTVVDPNKDFPSNLSATDLQYWQLAKQSLLYCRSQEILKRETAHPGTFTPGKVEVSWMQVIATQNAPEKISAVYEASRVNKLPAQVLTGALYQESMFSELGIAEDGGNFSCGVGQVNIMEWCRWANNEGRTKKKMIGWPSRGQDCSVLDPSLVKPFYEIAKTKLNGQPEYTLNKTHFAGIAYKDVVGGFPSASSATQQLRFNLVQGFINNCQGAHDGIMAKAHELASLYRQFVPAGLKSVGYYPAGHKFQRKCQDEGYTGAYPLNLGWLLAVGAYNAGPRAVDSLAYYNDWSAADLKDPATFKNFSVIDMVEAFYWSGVYDKTTDKIDLVTVGGNPTSWQWMKTCVLQRHIARVTQWVTLPGITPIVDTLEGSYRCAKSVFDPATGELITSAVPPFRQTSSGRK